MKAIRVFHTCSTARVCALVVCMMFATAALADSKEERVAEVERCWGWRGVNFASRRCPPWDFDLRWSERPSHKKFVPK